MENPSRIFVGGDHAGFELKKLVIERLVADYGKELVQDCGAYSLESTDYPQYAKKVADEVVGLPGSIGILICGSGIGVSIAANKVRGIRAALAWDVTSARLSRLHNGANVLCLGSRLIGREVAFDAVRTFLKTPFEEGRHAQRLEQIAKMEASR